MLEFFLIGLVLGAALGGSVMWLYLMEKYGGRRVDWLSLAKSFLLSMILGAVAMMLLHG